MSVLSSTAYVSPLNTYYAVSPGRTDFPVGTDLTDNQTIYYQVLPAGLWVVSVVGISFTENTEAVTFYNISANSAINYVKTGPYVYTTETTQGAVASIIPVTFIYQSDGVTHLQVTGACGGAAVGTANLSPSTLTAYRIV